MLGRRFDDISVPMEGSLPDVSMFYKFRLKEWNLL